MKAISIQRPAVLRATLGAVTALVAVTLLAFNAQAAEPAAKAPVSKEAKAIRAALEKKFDRLPPIDSIEPSAIKGLWEVRMGTDLIYADAEGKHLVKGEIIEVASKRNLTEERIAKLTAIDFASLPLQDAIVWKNGTGARKIAVFADPNCGYCKHFEQGLKDVKDVTVYTFLYPILGGDSQQKSEAIWCANDRSEAWNDWMRDGKALTKLLGPCTTPISRNLEFGRKYHINGTPAIFFEDGTRVPGALNAQALEEQFKKVEKKS